MGPIYNGPLCYHKNGGGPIGFYFQKSQKLVGPGPSRPIRELRPCFVLFDWALDSEIQLWVGPCCGVQPLAQGVGVFVTPLLPHLRREAGKPVRRSQERGYWEGSYGQFNPNTT